MKAFIDKAKNLVFGILPRRAIGPVLGVFCLQFFAYYVPKVINIGRESYDLTTAVDLAIPFMPVFVVFYVLAFIQWMRYYIIIAREEERIMRRYLTAGAVAKTVCMALFLIMPTAIERPVPGSGVFGFCCSVVYAFDEPTNLFPSMHCLESWFCLRLAFEELRLGRMPEVSRSIVKGYSGEMIHCVNKKQWKEIEAELVEITDPSKARKRVLRRRKWRLDQRLEHAADTAAEAAASVGEVYIRSHTFMTCLLSLLVFMSTLFIKQHYFLDFVSAIVLAEVSLLIGRLAARRA